MRENDVRVLLFHRVNPARDELWDPVDPRLFEHLLRYVKGKYYVLSATEYFASGSSGASRKPLMITFDDGYKDFVEYALPLLQKHHCPATMFVTTDCIETGRPTWTYLLDHCFRNTAKSSLQLAECVPGQRPVKYTWQDRRERLTFARQFKSSLKQMPAEERQNLTDAVLSQLDDVEPLPNLMMNWREVNEAASAGIEVGSHTKSHPPLAFISDERELWDEISGSAEIIRDKTGQTPRSISYPVGSYDRRVKELSERAGYERGYAVDQTVFDPRKHGPFSIPRIEVYNESCIKARLRIDGTISRLKCLMRK